MIGFKVMNYYKQRFGKLEQLMLFDLECFFFFIPVNISLFMPWCGLHSNMHHKLELCSYGNYTHHHTIPRVLQYGGRKKGQNRVTNKSVKITFDFFVYVLYM